MFGFGSSSDDVSHNQSTSTKNAIGNSALAAPPPKVIKPISKRNIAEEVASTHDLSVAKSERIVNTVFDTIVEAVIDGKQVRLSSFGSFDSYMSKARSGRNPNNGEAIEIASKRRIRFKAYDAFKKA